MKFCDPGLMADWIDVQNESTPWPSDGLEYKERGVDVRYDVPEPQNLNGWR